MYDALKLVVILVTLMLSLILFHLLFYGWPGCLNLETSLYSFGDASRDLYAAISAFAHCISTVLVYALLVWVKFCKEAMERQ